ncbi:hypothetical protein A2U01_0087438, partial [Trifolium medium]|nr:hypothetical protein [Trifolium medium]
SRYRTLRIRLIEGLKEGLSITVSPPMPLSGGIEPP